MLKTTHSYLLLKKAGDAFPAFELDTFYGCLKLLNGKHIVYLKTKWSAQLVLDTVDNMLTRLKNFVYKKKERRDNTQYAVAHNPSQYTELNAIEQTLTTFLENRHC
jgi:hypothetical protein